MSKQLADEYLFYVRARQSKQMVGRTGNGDGDDAPMLRDEIG
jgi:hypothetical protein